jgi:hypothetical protein
VKSKEQGGFPEVFNSARNKKIFENQLITFFPGRGNAYTRFRNNIPCGDGIFR